MTTTVQAGPPLVETWSLAAGRGPDPRRYGGGEVECLPGSYITVPGVPIDDIVSLMIFRRGLAEESNFLCSTLAEAMKQIMQRCRRSQISCFTLERVRHLSCARIPTKTLHCLYLYHARIRACSLTRTHRTDAHAPTSEHKAPQLHTIHTHVGAAALAAGYLHTCALLTGGGIECWGDNDDGQLGTGDTSKRNTPTRVTGLGSGASVCVS